MDIDSTTIRLAKRLLIYLPLPAAVAAATYVTTVCESVCPGRSAALTASAANLAVTSAAEHPLFSWCARCVATIPFTTLPLRLNLFSALCGILCILLLYSLVARLVFFFASESSGGAGRLDTRDLSSISQVPPEVAQTNIKILPLAAAAGLVGSFLFIFGVATWSASTRLDTGTFHLLLALSSFFLLLKYETTEAGAMQLPLLIFSFFLYALGFLDCGVFLLMLPCYLYFIFMAFLFSERRAALVTGIALAGLSATVLGFLAYCGTRTFQDGFFLFTALLDYAAQWVSQLLQQLRSFLPRSGWGLVVAQTGFPAMLLLFGMPSLFKERKLATLVTLLLLTLSLIPGFLCLSFSPWAFAQKTDRLPVFGFTLLALTAAVVFAVCLKILFIQDDERTDGMTAKQVRMAGVTNVCAALLFIILAVIAIITPFRSFPFVDARKTAFADAVAREMLDVMQSRTWMISNGLLDKHLLIQAQIRKQPFTLVPLAPRMHSEELRRLGNLIASDPLFDKLNRIRLQNALSIGTIRFVTEWLATDTTAGSHAMVLASPEIWTECRYRAIPEAVAFGGIPAEKSVDPTEIQTKNKVLFENVLSLLCDQDHQSPYVHALRRTLRTTFGFNANECGVLLEELNLHEAALESYEHAIRIDPDNVSAALNRYVLMDRHNLKPELLDAARKRIKAFENHPVIRQMTLPAILKTFGTIRQPQFYHFQSMAWASVGASFTASDKIGKEASLANKDGACSLIETGMQFLNVGQLDQAESCFKTVLAKDGSNASALAAMVSILLSRNDVDDAEKWLVRATRAGAPESELLHLSIALDILKDDLEKARGELQQATQRYPADSRYWIMLADVMLKQKDFQKVEFEVMPALQAALKEKDHYLVYATRGFLLKDKGKRYYKEARIAFLRALALNASLPNVWTALFEVDLALGNATFIDADAKNQLAIDPNHALANYLLGSSCLTRNALTHSEDFLRRSIEKTPTAAACNDLGENLRRQKRLKEAETFARQALAIQPKYLPALDTLACILLDKQQTDEAVAIAEMSYAENPSSPISQLTLLRVRIIQKNKDEADRLLKKLQTLNMPIPDDVERDLRVLEMSLAASTQRDVR